MAALDAARSMARALTLTPTEAAARGLPCARMAIAAALSSFCRSRRSASRRSPRSGRSFAEVAPTIAEQIETDAKYAVYLHRQTADIKSFRRDEGLVLPMSTMRRSQGSRQKCARD